ARARPDRAGARADPRRKVRRWRRWWSRRSCRTGGASLQRVTRRAALTARRGSGLDLPSASPSARRPVPPSGHPESYYVATANAMAAHPRLDGSVYADVCVIGGGFTGVSTALHLAERGYD